MNNGKVVLIGSVVSGLLCVGSVGSGLIQTVDLNRVLIGLLFGMLSFIMRVQHRMLEESMRDIKASIRQIERILLILEERTRSILDMVEK